MAVSHLYRAAKVYSFYPAGHPQRSTSLRLAHDALRSSVHGPELVVKISGVAIATDRGPVERNPLTEGFAKELSIRLVKKIVFLAELSADDLNRFLEIIALDPQEILRTGGPAALLLESGTRAIIVNDVTVPQAGKAVAAEPPAPPQTPAENELSILVGLAAPASPQVKRSLRELMELLEAEEDDASYARIGHELLRETAGLKNPNPGSFLACVVFLFRQSTSRRGAKKDHARMLLEAMMDKETVNLLLDRIEKRDPASADYLRVIAGIGSLGVRGLVERLFASESVSVRKLLAAAVVRIGEPALPRLREALSDGRWYVVRNAVAIMAAIGTGEVAYDLEEAVQHRHEKVMREAVLGLAAIGSEKAEQILLSLVENRPSNRAILAVHALGLMRSKKAVPALLRIAERRDLFLRMFHLKKEALVALAAIADPAATDRLLQIVTRRRLLASRRWQELKSWCVHAIAAIDGEEAIAALETIATRNDAAGNAARDALYERGKP